MSSRTNSRFTILVLGGSAIAALVLASTLVFGVTDDTIRQGEDSAWTAALVDPLRDHQDPTSLDKATFPSTFGGDGPARTLVLYDGSGPSRGRSEVEGLAAAHLATHFGQATLAPVASYTRGQAEQFDALIYIGSDPEEEIPAPLVSDTRAGRTPVLWAGANVDELAGEGGTSDEATFASTYGWTPGVPSEGDADRVTTIRYNGVALNRDLRIIRPLVPPNVHDTQSVEVLGTALCGSEQQPRQCGSVPGTEFPWAIRSGNLTYVGEVPFDFMDENSRYLAFADLYYDLLAPDTEPVRNAAVRMEDVGPEADPNDLREMADFMHARGIPFQVAVMPVHIATVPGSDPARLYGISLLDRPKVVSALKYMQERGGTLIQHGTSHQYGTIDNPYQGAATGADYEFYRAYCSRTDNPPYQFEPCEQTSWVRLTGPLARDTVQDHAERLEMGRQVMIEAGLGDPTIFEVPHYAASPNAYQAIGDAYSARYERGMYFAGLTTGEVFEGHPSVTQFFPYRVHDVYGTTVLPENLGNVTEYMQNNHPPRPPAFLIDNARRNLAVRESTASFFFHPFLDLQYLDAVVTGIEELGYTFIPADELP